MGCRRLVAEDPHGWLRGDTEETHGMREGFEKNTRQLHLWGCHIMECNIGTVSGRKQQIAAEFGRQSESRD